MSQRPGETLANDASEGQRWEQAQMDQWPEWPHMEPGAARDRIVAIHEELTHDPKFLWSHGGEIRGYLEEQEHEGDYPPMDLAAWVQDLALWIYFGCELPQ